MRIAKTLFTSEDLKIDFSPSVANIDHCVAITFTPFVAETENVLDGSGYAGDFLLANGFDLIAVKSSKNLWFQNLSQTALNEIQRFLETAEPNYKKRVGYGSSMGGYAAIQFSNALKLDVVLALSPQFAIDQPYDQRWALAAKNIVFQHRINQAAIYDRCKYFVAHDPRDIDTVHVEKLRALITPELFVDINIPFAGHPVSYYLAETGLIQDLALSAFRFLNIDNVKIHVGRKKSKTYCYELSKRLTARAKNKSALIAIDRAIAIDNRVDEFYLQRCVAQNALGQADAALTAAQMLATKNIQNTYLLGPLAVFLFECGDFETALKIINHALAIDSNSAELQYARSRICEHRHELTEAILSANHALMISPRSSRVALQLAALHWKQGGLRNMVAAAWHGLNALRLAGRKWVAANLP